LISDLSSKMIIVSLYIQLGFMSEDVNTLSV
jgi:hypothetical protein